ncbi:MAG: hypothetical protein GTO02_02835 [Candidatus Dadabacteria bacterium]|nr:hypothetical protein [Candidatus Dadabacteria bacterium]
MFGTLEQKINNNPKIKWLNIILLSLLILAIILPCIIRIGFKFSIDYNEGWNVYHGIRAVSEIAFYNDVPKWTPINYPPLSFYFVGFFGKLFGNPLLAGRFISILSLIITGFIVADIVRKSGGDSYSSVFSGLFCMALFSTYATHYVGMNDPQMLGHVFMMIGFLIYSYSFKNNLFLVALFFSLGLFTKHNLIALPIAVILDLLIRSRKDFVKFIISFSLIVLGFLIVVTLISGNGFVQQVFLTGSRKYSLMRAIKYSFSWGKYLKIPLLVSIPAVFLAFKNQPFRVVSLYLFISLGAGCYFSGGSGVDINIFFDTFISISILIGLLFSYLHNNCRVSLKHPNLIGFSLFILLTSSILINIPAKGITTNAYASFQKKEMGFLADAEFLSNYIGPSICENILLCYSSGKNFEYDPFNVGQLIYEKRIEEKEILDKLQSGYFKVIQLNKSLKDNYFKDSNYGEIKLKGRFTENFKKALGKYYTLIRKTENGAMYLFKTSSKNE